MSTPGVRRQQCRFCGRTLLFDDRALKVSHEVPECEAFTNLIAQAGKRGFGPAESQLEMLDPETGAPVGKPPGLA